MYWPGKENTKADALSRSPQRPAPRFGKAETEIQILAVAGDPVHTIDEMLQMEPVATLAQRHSFAEEQRNNDSDTLVFGDGEAPQ